MADDPEMTPSEECAQSSEGDTVKIAFFGRVASSDISPMDISVADQTTQQSSEAPSCEPVLPKQPCPKPTHSELLSSIDARLQLKKEEAGNLVKQLEQLPADTKQIGELLKEAKEMEEESRRLTDILHLANHRRILVTADFIVKKTAEMKEKAELDEELASARQKRKQQVLSSLRSMHKNEPLSHNF